MLFTTGFVLVHMEVDTFVDLLLDVSGGGDLYNDDEDYVIEKLIERFNEIDTDMSGCKCMYELKCVRCWCLHVFLSNHLNLLFLNHT